ncbi:DNA polymerase III subunit epsilon [Legionella israelensis]|uniref:DNA polymerase III subunit epsilon n=1 Tax=Legionella israelensis TaxID=454 RepID=A0A0W0VHI1_9GAMM|nr:DNA polymerase III subunit epsilon [Legionella israelensis]KTD19467.1 DNA polymerase III subunit epsilon [Legionella israelensis]QBR84154.1 DNA polymerase III subunit epsilon [Legionella israelensis]QBS08406.1 DNA polymerase III subunit epsilon [Legionella israelensis]SCX91974.1 DNA polymerase-3 subunit epsilon [Legionella israelensis DSM 19235]STX58041.1 DNA polymerase III subunit epsilon [Legionella israelensis]
MRQIVLDTETTGIGHEHGHRIIEIGCVELIDRRITKNHYHVYLNPQRTIDDGAFKVHGISNEFLKDKPEFNEIVEEFLAFIDGAELIIHNAPFDVGFLNSELTHVKWHKRLEDYCNIFDTLVYAREKHPGQRNSLDALCKRYDIDNSNRQLHGALLDAEILAWVYLSLTGGQGTLFSESSSEEMVSQKSETLNKTVDKIDLPIIKATEIEIENHLSLIELIVNKSGINYWEDSKTS